MWQEPRTEPPLVVGQLVTVHGHDRELPGTVTSVQPISDRRWEIWVEVLASFGVGASRHIIDRAGHEIDARTEHHGLACA